MPPTNGRIATSIHRPQSRKIVGYSYCGGGRAFAGDRGIHRWFVVAARRIISKTKKVPEFMHEGASIAGGRIWIGIAVP